MPKINPEIESSARIKVIRLNNELYFPAMPVWKTALVRVGRKHVPALDFNGFTDSVGHGGQVARVFPKRSI